MVRYCVIETGLVVTTLGDEYRSYPEMLINLLEDQIPNNEFDIVSVVNGERLPGPTDYAGYVIMGSSHSVYDDLPWIEPLLEFSHTVAQQRIPQIGICFGHQLIAKAMGGDVAPAPTGWRIGNHVYRISDAESDTEEEVVAFSYHQDQVLTPPPGVDVVASSETCRFGGFIYTETPAFSVQFHPEFRPAYFRDLVAATSDRFVLSDFTERALINVERPTDSDRFAEAIARGLAARPATDIVAALLGRNG